MPVGQDFSGVNGSSKRLDSKALALPLQQLRLSVRALRVLDQLDVKHVQDLSKLTPNILSGRRNCGRKTINEILAIIERFKPLLDEAAASASHIEISANHVADDAVRRGVAGEIGGSAVERIVPLLRRVNELPLSTRALNTLNRSGITYLGDLVQFTRDRLLKNRNFGWKSMKEIESLVETMGLCLGMHHPSWNHDLAAKLERKFQRQLNEMKLQELRQRISSPYGHEIALGWQVPRQSGRELQLEATLVQILEALNKPRNADILRKLYGWDGLGPRTLDAVGQEYGITRERVRQIAARFEKRVGTWVNMSDLDIVARAISHVKSRMPCRADLVERELFDLKISEKTFRIEGLLLIYDLIQEKPPFEVGLLNEVRFVSPPGTVGVGRSVLQVARYLVEHWGCTTVDEVGEHSSGNRDFVQQVLETMADLEWLDGDRRWFWVSARPRNRLLNQIQKVLSVTNPIDVGELRGAVGRHHRMAGFAPPSQVLLHLCQRAAGYGVTGRKVSAWPPIDPADVLSENELLLFRVLKRLGSLASKDELEENCLEAGMNRNSFAIYLSYSPIIARYGKAVYGLIGSEEVSASAVEALQGHRQANRALLDHGWTPNGRLWVAYRLSRSNLRSGLFHIPSGISDFVAGRFKLASKDGSALGELNVRDGALSGLAKIFERRGGEVGDIIVVCLNANVRESSVEIDGIELLERYALGSENLPESTDPSASGEFIGQ
jgi:Bacterial RNA polymerase, alpha chain C terminal domain/Sigma-70, region 4